jgi:amidase
MIEITRLSAGDIARAVASGDLSCARVMAAFADRIERLDGRVNAIPRRNLEAATRAAEALDAALADGAAPGPLCGVPVAIKDNFDVVGFPTTFGAAALRDNWPEADSAHVARLKAAGAIVVGKTNMPEFAFGEDTDNHLHGRTRNPYALDRTAGSSSGGAGAALALDMVPLADGSDLGGSTRAPGSWCNIVGYRPSTGVVPAVPSVAPFDRLHVIGPMARRVDDVRLMLAVTAGRDPRCPIAPPFGPEEFSAPLTGALSGLRIAFSVGTKGFPTHPAVTHALMPAADVLADAGAAVSEADPRVGFMAKSQRVFRILCAAEYAGWAADEHGLELGHDILDLVGQARRLTGYEMERAYASRAKAWDMLTRFFEDHDLICWPTTLTPAFVPGSREAEAMNWDSLYISPALDLPSISVPAGFVPGGLPVGLQIVGPPGSDRRVLEAAEAVERGLKAWERNPPRVALEAV